jgi:DNA-directed RNA polymerase specialized sigma54-like protein
VGLDISTISRVANSKYVDTPYGTFSVNRWPMIKEKKFQP